jgi:hypothetical protein
MNHAQYIDTDGYELWLGAAMIRPKGPEFVKNPFDKGEFLYVTLGCTSTDGRTILMVANAPNMHQMPGVTGVLIDYTRPVQLLTSGREPEVWEVFMAHARMMWKG